MMIYTMRCSIPCEMVDEFETWIRDISRFAKVFNSIPSGKYKDYFRIKTITRNNLPAGDREYYKCREDPFKTFIQEKCESGVGRIRCDEIWDAYDKFLTKSNCNEQDAYIWFIKFMKKKYTTEKINGHPYYLGIKLKEDN